MDNQNTSIDLAQLDKLLKRAHRVISCAAIAQIGDGEATWRDLGEFIACYSPLISGAPAERIPKYETVLLTGDRGRTAAATIKEAMQDELNAYRNLYAAPVHGAAAPSEIPDAWKLLVAGLVRELDETYKLIGQHAPKIEVTVGQFRRLRTAKEMLKAAGIPNLEGLNHE